MTKNIRPLPRRRAVRRIRFGASIQMPRGLLMLRALRQRLAAEKHPRFRQSEFVFADGGIG